MENINNFVYCDCGEQGCPANLFNPELKQSVLKNVPQLFIEQFVQKAQYAVYGNSDLDHEAIFDDYTDDLDFDNPDWVLWEWEILGDK